MLSPLRGWLSATSKLARRACIVRNIPLHFVGQLAAEYHSHREVGESFCVTYTVNGQQHRSTVERTSLSVQTAGICLDGFDANFDLQSLVGVIQEGQQTNQINRV